MTDETKTVDAVTLQCSQPTELTFGELKRWVIWQFPIPKSGGLCGAVRPPIANYGWLPALIRGKKQQVLVHGHLEKMFTTPQAAAEWLARYHSKDKPR